MNKHEMEFVGQFWNAALADSKVAWKAQALVSPPMLESETLGALYGVLSRHFSAGHPLQGPAIWSEIMEAGARQAANDLEGLVPHHASLMFHAERVVDGWRARRQCDLIRLGAEEAERSLEKPERAKKVAERLSMALLDVFAVSVSEGRPQTRDDLVDDQIDRMEREQERGVVLPWPKMQAICGPWMPGELIGLTGYSGSGKSTVTANLAMGLARRGTPVIVFPTEMREQWVARCAAAEAKVPQWIAEKGLWKAASEDQRRAYRTTLERMRSWPWEVVNRGNVTPAELVSAVRTLRRNWPGQTVVVVVDHMHRLDYGAEDADAEAGKATRMLKNFAGEDRDGLVFLLLYQPKKPEGDHAIYQPIHANRIRGHSMIWNELDTHLSVFRAWVERGPFGLTEWGDPSAALKPDGSPKVAKPFSEGAIVDEEHVFLKPDKRRVGGEGSTFWLNIHKPSGQIFELVNERALEVA